MSKFASFQTDAAAVAGFGADTLTTLNFLREERGVAITDLTQVAGAVAANDAHWQLFIDGMATRYDFDNLSIDPAAVGRNRILSPVRIHPRALIQFWWHTQAAAQANVLQMQYELIG